MLTRMASSGLHPSGMPHMTTRVATIFVVRVTETTVGVSWSVDNEHLLLSDIQLVPGFTVTCNVSNVHAYLLTTASVSVLRKLPFAYGSLLVMFHDHRQRSSAALL